jgi:TetR/AcrR family transcriptional regulator
MMSYPLETPATMKANGLGPQTAHAAEALNAPRGRGKVPTRGKGRPPRSEAGVGREAIIEAARELLRVKPPAKVTRDEIARYAGINPALIRYYFGDKSNLLTAVVEAIGDENLRRLKAALDRRGSPTEKLRRRIELILQMHIENPYYHQLIFEQLWQGESQTQKRLARKMVVPFFAEFKQIITEGQRRREFRGVDPRLVHVAALSMCELFINAPYVLKELFRIEQITPHLIGVYSRFVADLLLHGIGTDEGTKRRPRRRSIST